MKYFQEKVPAFQASPDGGEVPSVKIEINLAREESEGKTAGGGEQVQLRKKAEKEWEQQQQRETSEATERRFDHEEAEEVGGGEPAEAPAEQGRHAAHH